MRTMLTAFRIIPTSVMSISEVDNTIAGGYGIGRPVLVAGP
jgi:hypothetical protein